MLLKRKKRVRTLRKWRLALSYGQRFLPKNLLGNRFIAFAFGKMGLLSQLMWTT